MCASFFWLCMLVSVPPEHNLGLCVFSLINKEMLGVNYVG